MSIEAAIHALPFLQQQAEALMTATLTAYRPAPDITTQDNDGYEVAAYESMGTVRGKVQGSSATTSDTAAKSVRVGDVDRDVVQGGLHIPIAALVPAAGEYGVGWEYVVEDAGSGDPALVGTRWLVVNAPVKSYATARRLDVVQL